MTAVLMGLARFAATAILAVMVVFLTYRVFIKANTDFDEEDEIRKGNSAVGLLVAALLLSTANIFHQALEPLWGLLNSFTAGGSGIALWQLTLHAVAHLAVAFALAVLAISFSLRLFGRLTKKVEEGKELKKGNLAVGFVLSGVVFVVGLYIGEGVGALSKALVPQLGMTRMRVMR